MHIYRNLAKGFFIFAYNMAAHFHSLKIQGIERLTDECVSVSFDIPTSLQDSFKFVPGQYLTLRTEIEGQEVRRSYSICSCPSENTISVAIKRVPLGKFSSLANEHFKVGDEVEVMEPMGTFVIKAPGTEKQYLLIAAGSGITPMMSLMQHILLTEPNSKITLLYGNKSRVSIIFKEKIEALKNKFMQRLVVYHIFSREMADTELFNGRITQDKLGQFGNVLLDYNAFQEVFICGPEEMLLAARDFFNEKTSIDPHHVHVELFTSPDQPREMSEEWKQKLASINTEQSSKVTVRLDGVAFEMDLSYGGDNILDAALKHGADLPFACKGGVCATCKCKLIEGEVDMEVNYSLEPDELEKNFILSCQAHPRSEKVVVDFDIK